MGRHPPFRVCCRDCMPRRAAPSPSVCVAPIVGPAGQPRAPRSRKKVEATRRTSWKPAVVHSERRNADPESQCRKQKPMQKAEAEADSDAAEGVVGAECG